MKLNFYSVPARLAAIAMIGLLAVIFASAQDSPQSSAASKSAKFATIAKTDAAFKSAIDAHDRAGAEKLVGHDGAFRGKVTKAFSPRGGSVVILNFDQDYKTALTAVVKKSDFAQFPDLAKLVGQEVVVSGKFTDYKGSPEVELTDVKQIAIVK